MNRILLFMKQSWDFSKKYYVLLILDCAVSMISMYLNIRIPAIIVERIVNKEAILNIVNIIVLIVLVNLCVHVISYLISYKMDNEKKYINDMMNLKLSKKIMTIDYYKTEDPYYLDLRQKALYSIEVQDSITNLLLATGNLVKKIAIIIELFYIVFLFSKILFVVIIATTMVLSLIYRVYKLKEKRLLDELVVVNRGFTYYVGLCFDEKLQKDIRLYDMSELLTNKVRNENQKVLNYQKKYRKNSGLFNGFLSVIYILQNITAYSYVAYRAFLAEKINRITFGELTYYVAAIINLFVNCRDIIYDLVNCRLWISYLGPFLDFLEIDETLMDKNKREGNVSVEFRNVSFKYPGAEEYAVKNLSFFINKNEKVSIVGPNGAGKSTIVKLLCKLYKPCKGEIYVNGENIWDVESINAISTVFQDFKLFAISIAENIASMEKPNQEKLEYCIKKMDIDYLQEKYENGINTVLNKAYEDEGIDLSGGEKQKIAISRALYKNGSLFILDEPTSSLDPKSEATIFEEFDKITENRTTIFISHRMSSSTLCDKIFVLNHGTICDIGTHNELVERKCGLYYEMFKSQADNYKVQRERIDVR